MVHHHQDARRQRAVSGVSFEQQAQQPLRVSRRARPVLPCTTTRPSVRRWRWRWTSFCTAHRSLVRHGRTHAPPGHGRWYARAATSARPGRASRHGRTPRRPPARECDLRGTVLGSGRPVWVVHGQYVRWLSLDWVVHTLSRRAAGTRRALPRVPRGPARRLRVPRRSTGDGLTVRQSDGREGVGEGRWVVVGRG